MADISKIQVPGVATPYNIKDATARSDISTLQSTKAPLASPALTGTPTAPTAATATENTQIATTAYVKNKITDMMAAAQAMVFKGTIGTSQDDTWTAPACSTVGYYLPDASDITGLDVGWTYMINTAAKYYEHDYSGLTPGDYGPEYVCEVGDLIIIANDQDHHYWTVVQKNIDGAVTGPASSSTDHVATFKDATGKVIKDSGYTIGKSVPSNAVFTDTKNTVGATQHTSTLYVVGVLSSGGSASAQSYIDPSFSTTDGVIDCDGANIEGNTTIGTVSTNRTLTVNGPITATGDIKKGTTKVSLDTHRHVFTGDTETVNVSFSEGQGSRPFLTPTYSTEPVAPSWSCSVTSETLQFSWSAGTYPSYETQNVTSYLSGSVTYTPNGDIGTAIYPD